ncbi:hypothetical protein CMT41_16430 [Colwellia sp. MT41]|uniref:DNA polymerase n=1 Tax=Colwellia sp. MT41 TaxID=58049 RepID=UPI000717B0FC|nr:DNA polymerase [Colwellia sp. MT41]ALO36140.1 hypothetical protein CMT41_16430 [Colwellia sp. MT41]
MFNEDEGYPSITSETQLSYEEPSSVAVPIPFDENKLNTYGSSAQNKSQREKKVPIQMRPVLGFDTEYHRSSDNTYNVILSYQSYLFNPVNGRSCKAVFYPSKRSKDGRIGIKKFITLVIEDALKQGVLTDIPRDIFGCAHFLRADFSSFKNAFSDMKDSIKGLRNSVASLGETYGVDIDAIDAKKVSNLSTTYWDKNRNSHPIQLAFYDTMFFAPAGKTLKDVGEFVGREKLEIPEPYSIDKMDVFLKEEKVLFEEYGIRDAEISALHLLRTLQLCASLGLKGLPYTIGGIAVKVFMAKLGTKARYLELFALEEYKVERWSKTKNTPVTSTKNLLKASASFDEHLASKCYHGGRNEAFFTGPTPVLPWFDVDLKSCYSIAVSNLRPLDHENRFHTKDINDFSGDVFGLAWVEFEFPTSVQYPTLPVRTDSDMLVFTQKGFSYCTAQEIDVSRRLGVKIVIKEGLIIPWLNDDYFCVPFMHSMRAERNKAEKGSFEDRMFKELSNTLYGKIAQGVKSKTSFEISSGLSKPVSPSVVTNPYFAAYITGLARAVIGDMINAIPTPYSVLSVTTDGFITDAPLTEIPIDSPVCNLFRESYHRMDDTGGDILEEKHRVNQLLVLKTRGQLTLKPCDGHPSIIAKAGVKTPNNCKDQNAYMVDLYLNRTPQTKTDASHLTATRPQFIGQQDLMMVPKMCRLNLEPDLKRKLLPPIEVEVNGVKHVAMGSVPYEDLQTLEQDRLFFTRWRANNNMKTLADYASWDEFVKLRRTKNLKGVNLKVDETADAFLVRLFLRVIAQEQFGVTLGYGVKPNAISSAKKAKVITGAVPLTANVIKVLKLILIIFPDFDYQAMIAPEYHLELKQLMSSI